MLNRMCVMLPCRNMYVMIDHGRASARTGTNIKLSVTPGIVCWTKYIPTLAISRRCTQRVMSGSCSPAQYIIGGFRFVSSRPESDSGADRMRGPDLDGRTFLHALPAQPGLQLVQI